MTRTISWVRDKFQKMGPLQGGHFGFDTENRRLFAGFGKHNRRVLLDTDDTGWVEVPVLENGWEVVLFGEPVAYRICVAGLLHLKGDVRYGALNYHIFRLPEEIRNRQSRDVPCNVIMDDGFCRLDVTADGYVIPTGTPQLVYDEITGEPTGEIVEIGHLSLEARFIP